MRRLIVAILVSSILVTLAFAQKGRILYVKASYSIHQGDLILTGNNVTVIEGRFDINGSIIVEDNATLHLKDACLNFTQQEHRQYNMTLRNPSNGNPRLLSYNSTITSNFQFIVYIEDNSTARIKNSTLTQRGRGTLFAEDYSFVSISNSSYIYSLYGMGRSNVSVHDSTIGQWQIYFCSEARVYNSQIGYLLIGSESVNCTISKLEPGLKNYWSFITNCSVNVMVGGSAPNITLTNTNLSNWRFAFYGASIASILNSTIWEAFTTSGSSVISLKSTTCSRVYAASYTMVSITDSSINLLDSGGLANSWLLNSTYTNLNIWDSAKVYVSWYLDIHVIDSADQDVPLASVTATYQNGTVAESRLTDADGWTRLTLMEKMINASGEYPVGNYTVEATLGPYSSEAGVNMTRNKQITLSLEKPSTPLEALEELIHTAESWNLDTGIETSLTSKLQAAYRLLDMENQKASIGQLTAFMNEVEALREKKLTNELAYYLIAEAQRIIDLIRE